MGTSDKYQRHHADDGDHPHAYGDKVCCALAACSLKGSSPRVWGQACPHFWAECLPRIIPTRMGTREMAVHITFLLWDHPHAYGDKACQLCVKQRFRGSSPRVWGQEGGKKEWRYRFRIIPTRMGTRQRNQGK